MITSKDEFLRRLADIQNELNLKELVMIPEDEPRFIIDLDTRKIIVPDEFKFLAVENDHNAETIYFEIDRYFDKQDLSEKTCIVQYSNGNGDSVIEGFFPVTKLDIDTLPGKILFGWTIKNNVTSLPGVVEFSIRFYSIDDSGEAPVFTYNINTLKESLPVVDTLNTADKSVEILPGEVESLTEKFTALAKQASENAAASKASEIAAKNSEGSANLSASQSIISAANAKASEKIALDAAQQAENNATLTENNKLAAALSEQNSAISANNARKSEISAAASAALAEQAANSKGWMYFDDEDNSGTLYLITSDNLQNDVTMRDDGFGNLEVIYE